MELLRFAMGVGVLRLLLYNESTASEHEKQITSHSGGVLVLTL